MVPVGVAADELSNAGQACRWTRDMEGVKDILRLDVETGSVQRDRLG